MGVDLSGVLPQALDELGWTQQQLADAARMKRTDINAIANGKPVGEVRLRRILDALGKTEAELGIEPVERRPRNPVLRELEDIRTILTSARGERHHEHHDLQEQVTRQSALLEELVGKAESLTQELAETRRALVELRQQRPANGATR